MFCRSEPGNSAGSSGVDGAQIERGRLGRGFCKDTDLAQTAALGTGDRSISLKTDCRLDAALTRAALYWAETGLRVNWSLSGSTILRFDGRRRSMFGVV